MAADLPWLPPADPATWLSDLQDLRSTLSSDPPAAWSTLLRLAHHNLGPTETGRLDRDLTRLLAAGPFRPAHLEPVRLALLGSSTTRHLLPSLRIAALRRGLLLHLYEGGFGQYLQETLAPPPDLLAFQPEAVLYALDAHHLAALGTDVVQQRLQLLWRSVRENLGAPFLLQQTALPLAPELLGANEHRLPASAATHLASINTWLRSGPADAAGVHLLALDQAALRNGLDSWHDPSLWHLAKQEVHPNAAPLFGDLVARLLAAARGRSRKVLVLDLDNTLWHGVVGDDGPSGIQVGQGSALAEAHLALHHFAASLRERGILLAVCSKNDDSTARAAFQAHPGLPLQLSSFAAFHANWQDKATNLRAIAHELNLSLDALVFADDNPAERDLIRRELPEVAVPELGSDPSRFVPILSRAGYFEALTLTSDDRARAGQYAARTAAQPSAALTSATDLRAYLQSLEMRSTIAPFSEANLPRIVQLANKTNQFNLTGLRLTPDLVRSWLPAPDICHPDRSAQRAGEGPASPTSAPTITLQATLTDRFGDHGTVALLAAELTPRNTLQILLWVMSCRVFGRELEHLCRNHLVLAARQLGADVIEAPLHPTPKNALLRDRLLDLGFTPTPANPDLYTLPAAAQPLPTAILA